MTGTSEARLAALKRLRKCLRLAASATEPGEIAAALRQAQKLMAIYGLTEEDAELADIKEATTAASGFTSLALWEMGLIDCVRYAFGVGALFQVSPRPPKPPRGRVRPVRRRGRIVFIGPEARVEVALYAYESLYRQLKRARAAFAADWPELPRSALDTFAAGWVIGVEEKIQALTAPFALDAATELALRQRASGQPADARTPAVRSAHAALAFAEGAEAAEHAVLNAGVTASIAEHALPAEPKKLGFVS